MKLLYCNHCGDVFNLTGTPKYCSCDRVFGKYINNYEALISDSNKCIVLYFDDQTFSQAVESDEKNSYKFDASTMTIPNNLNIRKVNRQTFIRHLQGFEI